jgi:membrane protein DedA with SNARE-associated domain
MEQEQGWDPEVKRFFRKIISSFSAGLLWMMAAVTAGLYFGLAYRSDISIIWIILFYICLTASLLWLISYLYRLWKN